MAKVKFQADGIDDNLNAEFNGDVRIDGNLSFSGLSAGMLIVQSDKTVTTTTAPTTYSAPTIGSTSVASGATVTTIADLTLTTPTIASFVNATHNHTNSAGGGTLTSSAISDFTEAAQDAVNLAFTAGTGISKLYDDSGNTITINNTGILSVSGTSNQISASTTSGEVTLSIPNTFVTPGDLTVTGNLTVNGTQTIVNTTNLGVTDSIIYLAESNFDTDSVDIGIYGAYGVTGHTGESGHYHTGFVRDASDSKWKLFSVGAEPTSSVVDFSSVIYDTLVAGSFEPKSSTTPVNGIYLPSTNTIGIASNSTQRMTFDANGGINLLSQVTEKFTPSATSANSSVNFDVLTNKNILYYTSNSGGNWTLNIRGNSSTSLDSVLSIGQSLTLVFMVTNGSTAYYQTALQIDGTSVSPKWQGGTAPSAGNASSIDVYELTIMKTASATYTVLESISKFA